MKGGLYYGSFSFSEASELEVSSSSVLFEGVQGTASCRISDVVMLCSNPFINYGAAYGCGQCMSCRINKRREWAHRILLEASQYKDNAFVTLTYDDEHLPDAVLHPGGTLVPRHLQLWLKRMRRQYEPRSFRFYAVGEYGDHGCRAHYHAVLFNYWPCQYGKSIYSSGRRSCCASCDCIRDTWGQGIIECQQFEPGAADYIAGYVTKKMTRLDDPRLEGRFPEFARMSNRPGIGAGFMEEVASQLLKHDAVGEDVPHSLRHGRSVRPIGRYLRRRLRTLVGMEPNAPQSTLDEAAKRMRPVQEAARFNPGGFKAELVASTLTKRLSLEAKTKIFKKRRSL